MDFVVIRFGKVCTNRQTNVLDYRCKLSGLES